MYQNKKNCVSNKIWLYIDKSLRVSQSKLNLEILSSSLDRIDMTICSKRNIYIWQNPDIHKY